MNKPEKSNEGMLDIFNPQKFEYMQRLVRMLINSELVPDIYRAKNAKDDRAFANALIAVEIAHNMEMSPFMVMQNLDIINGKPSFSGKFIIARINTSGMFEALKFEYAEGENLKGLEYNDYEWNPETRKKNKLVRKKIDFDIMNMSCFAYTTPIGKEEPVLIGMEISIELAIKEGWFFRNGSKWKTMPKQMLTYRAAAFWMNLYAPQLSMGLRSSEENVEIIEAEVVPDEEPLKPTAPENKPNKPQDEEPPY